MKLQIGVIINACYFMALIIPTSIRLIRQAKSDTKYYFANQFAKLFIGIDLKTKVRSLASFFLTLSNKIFTLILYIFSFGINSLPPSLILSGFTFDKNFLNNTVFIRWRCIVPFCSTYKNKNHIGVICFCIYTTMQITKV